MTLDANLLHSHPRRPPGWLLVLALSATALASCKSKQPEGSPPSEPENVSEASREKSPARPPTVQAAEGQAPAPADRREWMFENIEPGKLPEGWTVPVGEWRVETTQKAAGGSRVLAQTASNGSPVFNVALVPGSQYGDVDITVRVRAREGRIDQGGGVIWRAKDAQNYYIARYNPLEDNYRLYTVKDGRRQQLESAEVEVDHQAWHTLRVKMVGEHIQCFLDGKKHLEARDGTFADAGMVGLWTKADARTEFDDFSVSSPSLK